jgi:hypothetical protein
MNIEMQVISFLKSKEIPVDAKTISACHTLPLNKNSRSGTKSIVVRFTTRKAEEAILKNGKKLVNTGVYVSEHLTQKNARLAKLARMMKKSDQTSISRTWTWNGKIFIKWQPSTPGAGEKNCENIL